MGTVTIYGADWCGDCRRAKRWFVRNNVAHTWIDLVESPNEIETVIRFNGGRKSIPVVVFPDGTHLTEPTDADLDAKYAEVIAGSSPSSAEVNR
jgi:glutaredoxin